MNGATNNINIKKIIYKKQNNSNQRSPENSLKKCQSPQLNKKLDNINKNIKNSRTPLSMDATPNKSILLNEKKKFNLLKKFDFEDKYNCFSEETNKNKLKRQKSCNNFNCDSPSYNVKKKNRPKALSPKPSYLSFKNILDEFTPVIGKISNLPKNKKLYKIFRKINARIDNRTFLRIKYNKRTGILFIKFRNKYYYNYYYSLLNGRQFNEGLPNVEISKIEEDNFLWIKKADEEDKVFYDKKVENNLFYKDYISSSFRNIKHV